LPPNDGDGALCGLAAAGDRLAFAALVSRHEHRVRRFLAHLAGADLADELAQESFVRAWQALPRFRGEASFPSWICAIGWRCYLDHRRRQRSEIRRREAVAAEPAEAPAPGPDQALDLAAALARLDAVERAALVLCDGHGWSHVDAAAILGLPLGTIKGTISRAKKKCRAMLTEPVP
jgi:RNA polymerase sigma-70 factor (ECF subfamily)